MTLATQTSFWGYVITSYCVVFGVVAAYAARTLARGRRITRDLPPEDRRWM